MYKYYCEYCGDPLCPELCDGAQAAQAAWLEEITKNGDLDGLQSFVGHVEVEEEKLDEDDNSH